MMNTRQDDNISIYNIRETFMEKKDKIKKRIMEHKGELDRLYRLPRTIEKSLRMTDIQIFNIKKAIQNLTGKFLRAGGRIEELEPKIEKKETAPIIIREEKKVKRGRKGKK